MTWKGDRDDFVEEGDADREGGCRPRLRCRRVLIGDVSGSRGGLDAASTDVEPVERRTKTDPSLHPNATPPVLYVPSDACCNPHDTKHEGVAEEQLDSVKSALLPFGVIGMTSRDGSSPADISELWFVRFMR